MSTEFDKNISDWSCTDYINGKNNCWKKPIFLEVLEKKVFQKL